MPAAGFSDTKGAPKQYFGAGLERRVTREFCAECGAQIATRAPGFLGAILKVETLDDPSVLEGP